MSGPACQSWLQTIVGFFFKDGPRVCHWPNANGTTQTAIIKSSKNAPRIRCALIAGPMCAFTLLALRCAKTFYSKRIKDVETYFGCSAVQCFVEIVQTLPTRNYGES